MTLEPRELADVPMAGAMLSTAENRERFVRAHANEPEVRGEVEDLVIEALRIRRYAERGIREDAVIEGTYLNG